MVAAIAALVGEPGAWASLLSGPTVPGPRCPPAAPRGGRLEPVQRSPGGRRRGDRGALRRPEELRRGSPSDLEHCSRSVGLVPASSTRAIASWALPSARAASSCCSRSAARSPEPSPRRTRAQVSRRPSLNTPSSTDIGEESRSASRSWSSEPATGSERSRTTVGSRPRSAPRRCSMPARRRHHRPSTRRSQSKRSPPARADRRMRRSSET